MALTPKERKDRYNRKQKLKKTLDKIDDLKELLKDHYNIFPINSTPSLEGKDKEIAKLKEELEKLKAAEEESDTDTETKVVIEYLCMLGGISIVNTLESWQDYVANPNHQQVFERLGIRNPKDHIDIVKNIVNKWGRQFRENQNVKVNGSHRRY